MEENKEAKGICACGASCGCWYGKRHSGRIVFLIIAFIVVFCMGVSWGEVKSSFRSEHGYHGMMLNRGYYPNPGMMGDYRQNQNLQNAPTNTTPTPPVTNPTTPLTQ